MKKPITVAVLCGGRSVEHEVSLRSAKTVVNALDPHQYTVLVIYVDHEGQWFLLKDSHAFIASEVVPQDRIPITVLFRQATHPWVSLEDSTQRFPTDIVFPVIHGSQGEDGALQGLLEMVGIPYVGSRVLGSALCMDSAISRQLLYAADIPLTGWLEVKRQDDHAAVLDRVIQSFGFPLFVKPSNHGSSVGVNKVKNEKEFEHFLQLAFKYDDVVLVEQGIEGVRELECAILGNEFPRASLPGEVIPHHEFYSYDAKYVDPNGASFKIPADLPAATVEEIQALAIKAYELLQCEGMARIDFFMTPEGRILLNELNTIPGLTSVSLYPKLWEASGIPRQALFDHLIKFALDRHQHRQTLTYRYIDSASPTEKS